jgi:uncharacterized protein YajQ (UPF0234 family)
MEVHEMTEQFIKHTLLHYSLEDVGEHKVVEWYEKLSKLKGLASEEEDKKLVKLIENKDPEVRAKWQGIL